MADLDTAFVQQILQIAKRKRKPHIQHHGQADDLWGCLEVAKKGSVSSSKALRDLPAHLKPVSFDTADLMHAARMIKMAMGHDCDDQTLRQLRDLSNHWTQAHAGVDDQIAIPSLDMPDVTAQPFGLSEFCGCE